MTETKTALMKELKANLKAMCEERNLDTTGIKATLVERILAYVEPTEPVEAEMESQIEAYLDTTKIAKPEALVANNTKAQLVELAQMVKVAHNGTKLDIANRIVGRDQPTEEPTEEPVVSEEPTEEKPPKASKPKAKKAPAKKAPKAEKKEIHFTQTSSLSRHHFQIRAPKHCPSCGRSNNWTPVDLRPQANTDATHRTCQACGIEWNSQVESIEETDGQREVIFRDEITSVGIGEYSWRARLPENKAPVVGLKLYSKSIILDRSVRDQVKSTCNWATA